MLTSNSFPLFDFLNEVREKQSEVVKTNKRDEATISSVFLGHHEFRTLCHFSIIRQCIVYEFFSTHFPTAQHKKVSSALLNNLLFALLSVCFLLSSSNQMSSEIKKSENQAQPIYVEHLSHHVIASINQSPAKKFNNLIKANRLDDFLFSFSNACIVSHRRDLDRLECMRRSPSNQRAEICSIKHEEGEDCNKFVFLRRKSCQISKSFHSLM